MENVQKKFIFDTLKADSRVFHLISVTNPANFIIRTLNTDVLVIELGCPGSMSSDIKVPFAFSVVNWY